ncbi:ABC transporter substrate-binding protein [Rhodovastum atsumiense]|uniref:ABC transporter substrate-binding protein n=2 Tax=Rhodovastum atsumiense TaxID=504468 RepID=A0A5M6III3_9PROT|nr:ABC transporter substrate-binding protein [Rhodovastum atsumiense]KAA5608086.1 ABC transporter substrate-binding protein [Rhodovastum atsumiense]CAH2604909.1 ABC transporter substrate-binding protein [Rhodovastum atsumiense]
MGSKGEALGRSRAKPWWGAGQRPAKLAFVLAVLLSPPARAAGVVSLNLCADQFLLLLAPEQALAVTQLAREPSMSVVAGIAPHVPAVRADAEAVLRLRPDLVLAGRFGAQTTLALLERRGLRVERIDMPQDFPAIRAETRRLAALLGVPARGEALLADMETRLAVVPPERRPRAVMLQARGYVAAPGSLPDSVLRAAGLEDVGAGGQPGLEALVAHPPELLVTATAPAFPSMATDVLRHPALAAIPRREVAPALLLCGGPWTARAVQALAR